MATNGKKNGRNARAAQVENEQKWPQTMSAVNSIRLSHQVHFLVLSARFLPQNSHISSLFFIHLLLFFFQISKFARDVTRRARRLFVAIKKSGKLAREYS